MEAEMTWVCAECGGDFLFHGHIVKDGVIVGSDIRCSVDESHRGEMRKEDYLRMKEVIAQQDIRDMFGDPDLR